VRRETGEGKREEWVEKAMGRALFNTMPRRSVE
jgi:hypothetical protein